MIHVSVDHLQADNAEKFRDAIKSVTDEEVIVTDSSVALHDIPALDDYADELAKRVAEELKDR
ncbi:hypothetical protein HFTV1-gp22 [Haloferax tailed virus 1]|uniref:Uncharacterized protein n=1 Tax=Haloferax tailed virus 1 TaxID=2507575 RepID=A0A410N710_HFTV1|nr:hypothetical protein M1M17_gp22 [Haloferax tailed virus 1]QAS68855.1 hypothetical protein HFTV1-gp22 [Haloferax tailed virus 1]